MVDAAGKVGEIWEFETGNWDCLNCRRKGGMMR